MLPQFTFSARQFIAQYEDIPLHNAIFQHKEIN